MAIASINPATGETLATFEALPDAAIEERIAKSAAAFQKHRKTPLRERAACLLRAAQVLEDDAEFYGAIMTAEMGKTIGSAVGEARKCATACRYYAENGESQLADETIETGASRSFVRYQPIGPVLAIMPWNFPFWQVFRFAAPALMAGNTGLLKHASNVPECALAIEDILKRAGFADGVFQTLLVEASKIGSILDDDRIAAATLTGSEPAGQEVASRAGRQIKKTVLELGGSDPFIVLPSTDIGPTVKAAVAARTINNGQSCIAAKRFIVADAIYDAFEEQFTAAMAALRVGDPMHPATQVGPLATHKIRNELHAQVERAQQHGASVLTGGKLLEGSGYFYPPTVLSHVARTSPVYYEEFFGPVAMLFRVPDVHAAIELANDSPFGLGASVWTEDALEGELCIEEIESGQVFVNAPVASDARLPFGGVKRSGYGRELSTVGIREFVNIKTVWCK